MDPMWLKWAHSNTLVNSHLYVTIYVPWKENSYELLYCSQMIDFNVYNQHLKRRKQAIE